ncbi:MAG: NifU family protein [Clostridiales bacterium]|nr:NifU family protein [Clostridiales bacterium]
MTKEKIQEILETKVNPILSQHFGGAQLVSFENSIARVRMTGACASCPSAQMTIQNIVKEIIMDNCEGVSDVVLDSSVGNCDEIKSGG